MKPSDTISVIKTPKNDELHITLNLDKLRLNDAGRVTVKASNLLGDVSSTAVLTVKGQLKL